MTSKRITQIPLPGGCGRVPTGAIQFQNDWPGLFLRGDTVIPLMVNIRAMEEALAEHTDPRVISALGHLESIADIIEHDVVVRGES